VQAFDTAGIDAAIQYDLNTAKAGLFQFRIDATKVNRWDLQGIPGGPVTHFDGVLVAPVSGPIPKYKANATLGWSNDRFSAQWQTRFQDSYGVSEVDPPSSRDPFFTDDYYEHDVRATFKWNDSLSFLGGIVNVTGEEPPLVPEAGNGTGGASSTFDNRGRWFYVGANYSFQPPQR